MRTRTQSDRVVRMLRLAGRQGIDQTQVGPPVAGDGGKPILRLASRIAELRAAGHNIVRSGRRHGCAVYRLVEAGSPARPAPPAAPGRDAALFPRAIGSAPPLSPYDPRADA